MKKAIMFLIIIINFILQTSLYNFMQFFPDISLILIIIFALYTDGLTGALFGIFTGILYDIMLMDVFGIYTLLFFLAGAIIGSINEDLNIENIFTFISITFVTAVMWHILMYVLLFFLGLESNKFILIIDRLIVEVLLDALFAGFVHKLIVFIFDKLKIKLSTR